RIYEECVHILHRHNWIPAQPNNHLQLYTCSFDFKIKLWDYIDNILINTFILDINFMPSFFLLMRDYLKNVATISWSSKDSNLFVLEPSELRPFCIQKDISKEEVYGGLRKKIWTECSKRQNSVQKINGNSRRKLSNSTMLFHVQKLRPQQDEK
ncbi:hypothetical protein EI555_000073, partial [Monodon monoceros]